MDEFKEPCPQEAKKEKPSLKDGRVKSSPGTHDQEERLSERLRMSGLIKEFSQLENAWGRYKDDKEKQLPSVPITTR